MRFVLVLSLAVSLSVAWPAGIGAEPQRVPQWPSEREERLSRVESELLEAQRKLAAARREGNGSAVDTLSREFKELQDERVKLLRATGALRN